MCSPADWRVLLAFANQAIERGDAEEPLAGERVSLRRDPFEPQLEVPTELKPMGPIDELANTRRSVFRV